MAATESRHEDEPRFGDPERENTDAPDRDAGEDAAGDNTPRLACRANLDEQ